MFSSAHLRTEKELEPLPRKTSLQQLPVQESVHTARQCLHDSHSQHGVPQHQTCSLAPMWRRVVARQWCHSYHTSIRLTQSSSRPIIHLENATFYRRYPSASDGPNANPPTLSNLSFSLAGHGDSKPAESWAVVSPSSIARTTFLQILAGQHICTPPQARSYPYLSELSQSPQHAIKYVGFDAERGTGVGGTDVRGAYLSARYESRREETDFTVHDYLTGHTELNALEPEGSALDLGALHEIVSQLNLRQLLHMPVANLSNGQTRRARIAKALMAKPEVLLLDGPFMGLDPNALRAISRVLGELAERQQPRLVMSLRPEDGVPQWVSHLVVIDKELFILAQGAKDAVEGSPNPAVAAVLQPASHSQAPAKQIKVSRDGFEQNSPALPPGEALVEMNGVKVAYGEKVVLGEWQQEVNGASVSGLWWSLHRGQRCAILGPNGSGKTTMLSLITSDHPQTYSLPVKLFGRFRLPGPGQPGISLFDIQRRMGHSSPEVHAFFPKQVTVRRALESAWADAPLAKPALGPEAHRRVNAFLRWFARDLNSSHPGQTVAEKIESAADEASARDIFDSSLARPDDLQWATEILFRDLSFSNQRLTLFLRAIIALPDLVILDEALSGVDETTRDKALLFLSQGEKISQVRANVAQDSMLRRIDGVTFEGLSPEQALIVISHSREDVPGCVREWIRLPEPGEGRAPNTGSLPGPLELNPQAWDEIWAQ